MCTEMNDNNWESAFLCELTDKPNTHVTEEYQNESDIEADSSIKSYHHKYTFVKKLL